MHDFSDVNEVEQVLESLASREDGPFVVRLAREPGKRESRYMHLFSGEVNEAASPSAEPGQEQGDLSARVAELEREMAAIKQQLAQLSGSV